MTNEYLDRLIAEHGTSAPGVASTGNPYLALMEADAARESQQFLATTNLAVDSNPDQVARQKRVASLLGQPLAAVQAMPEFSERAAKVKAVEHATVDTPTLRQKFTEADFAALAHDDADNLGTMERVLRTIGTSLRSVARFPADLASATYGTLEGGVKAVAPVADGLLPINPLRQLGAGLEDWRKKSTHAGDLIQGELPKDMGYLERNLYGASRSFGNQAPGLAASILTRNPAYALGSMGLLSGGNTITERLDKGASPWQALVHGGVDAGYEVLFERYGVNKLLGDVAAGSGFGKMLLGQIVREVPSEMATTLGQQFNAWALEKPEQSLKQFVDELGQAEQDTVVQTIMQTVMTAGLGRGMRYLAERDQARVENAEQGARALEQLQQLAAANKVLQRDPEALENFINEAAADGATHVFIGAEALAQSGLAEQVAEASPSVAEQFAEKWQTGGDIAVPIGEYVAKIGSQSYAQQLLDHVKLEPDGFSRAEAAEHVQKHAEQQQAEVERILGEKQVDDDFKASAERVKQAVLDNLNTANRFSPQVNEAYATLESAYNAVRAADMGITPEEFFVKHRLTVLAEPLQGAQVFDQGDGPFGPVLTDFKGNAQGAIAKLTEMQNGEAVGALHHPDIGDIDLVWGEEGSGSSDGYGLAKLLRWHPEVVDNLQGILSSMAVVSRSKNRVNLESDEHRAGVRLTFDNQTKHWLLTAFKKKDEGVADTRTDTIDISGEGDTARLSDASDLIVDQKIEKFYQAARSGLNQSPAFDGPETGSTPIGEATEIEVDGVMRPALNSTGKPIHPTQEGVRNFWKWFGDSRVVDEQGRPLVVYHGTNNDFSKFDLKKLGENTLDNASSREYAQTSRVGFWFNTEPMAQSPENYKAGYDVDMPVYLSIAYPKKYEGLDWLAGSMEPSDDHKRGITGFTLRKKLKDYGYDGVQLYDEEFGGKSYVAFSPTQIKSATGNRGTFDGRDANILHQSGVSVFDQIDTATSESWVERGRDAWLSARTFKQKEKPEGKNAVTGDLDRVNPAVREAVLARIARLPADEQERVRSNLEKHKGTSWAAAAVKGMAYREMLERALVGQDISNLTINDIWGAQDMAATKLIQAFQKYPQHGDNVLRVLLNAYDFVGGNRKAENDISTSFTNCNPTKGCATHCYAANANARPTEIAKSEFTEFMLDRFPEEMADKIAGDYMATAAGKAGLSLRLNDKGDLSPAQVRLVENLNKRGIAVQVFSKRPELLRQLSDMNLKMLSVDSTNLDLANTHPDLRLAVTITDGMTEDMLAPLHDRVSVYLPVNLKGHTITQEELKTRFPNLYGRMRKENLCPVDGGHLVTKPGTSFVDIRDKTAEKGVWTCTSCDLTGCVGCFKGDRKTTQRKAQAISVADLRRELELKRVRRELQSNLDTMLALGGIDGELHKQLSEALSSGQRAILEIADRGTEGGTGEGSSGTLAPGQGSGSGIGRDAGDAFAQGSGNRGAFDPVSNTIALLKGADLSTFLHESGHYFFETDIRLAAELVGEQRDGGRDVARPGAEKILRDVDALLTWHGMQGPLEEKLRTWYSMSLDEKRAAHERTAESFERYLMRGEAPSLELQPYFQRFRAWLLNVYRSIKDFLAGHPEAGKLNPEVTGVFDRMLATNEQIALAEQSRSMAPLFATAEAAGWTPEEFAAYQAAGIDATNAAIEGVQAAAVRDMAYIRNATARMLQRLKRRALGLRLELQADATREVMRQPVYQAWQFLTGKLSEDDKLGAQVLADEAKAEKAARQQALEDAVRAWTDAQETERVRLLKAAQDAALQAAPRKRNGELKPQTKKAIAEEKAWIDAQVKKGQDAWLKANPKPEPAKAAPRQVDRTIYPTHDSLFTAIAKLGGLSRETAAKEWGLDPATRSPMPVFGLHVLRRTGGLKLDAIAEALAQYGYLTLDENGKWELNELEEKFHAELNGAPQYSVFHAPELNNEDGRAGTGADIQAVNYGRLDEAGLRDIAGLAPDVVERLVKLKMTARVGGWHPDFVAERFGFSSGEALVDALAAAMPPKDEIEGLTDQRMLEEHGELATPEAIAQAADKAVHNEARARVLATEANALARAAGTGAEKKILATAVKQIADRLIARASVKDILGNLLVRQYGNAEVRAARAAGAAFKAGDVATAAAEKRNQVINNAATRAAYDAQDEVRESLRKLTALANKADKKLGKSFDIDIINAVRAVLGEYGIAPRMAQKAQAYLKTLETNDPATYALVSQAIQAAEANAQPVETLTVEEFRGLKDELDAMLHLARRMRQMEVDGNLMDRQDIEDALHARLEEVGIPDTIPGETGAVTPGEERMAKLQTFIAAARRMESWVTAIDGSEFGPFRRYIFQPIKDAADQYRAKKTAYLKQYRALLDAIAPTLKPQAVEAPELGYTFGKGSGGSGIAEVLHAILHTGNESNKRKLLLGRGWAVETAPGVLDTSRWDAFIARLAQEGKLTPAHFDFAQGVWDMLEAMKPAAQKAHRDAFGKYFDEVAAAEFVDPFGTVRRGGYVPAIADSRVVADAELRSLVEEESTAMAYAFPSPSKGFTMARTEYNKPLLLDLRSLSQHIDKVLLFSYMTMPARDVEAVLKRKVGQALHRVEPAAMSGMIRPWLNRAARQQVETPIPGDKGLMRFFSVLRARAGMAAMMGNVVNTVQQITGFSLAGLKVGKRRMLSATADWLKAPRDFAKAVATASPYMAQRMEYEVGAMNDAINEVLLNPTLLEKGQQWTLRHAYFMQSAFDNVMSPIIWTAAYNQHIEAGQSHQDAVRLADGVVRTTQGSTLAEDVSRFETGNAFVRLFTQFAGYFNMQANLLGTEFIKVTRDLGLRRGAGRGLYVLTLGFLVPALVAELVVQAFRGGPDDEDEDGEYLDDWLAALFMGTLRTATAMVPVAGQAVNSLVNAFNSKPYDDRIASSPAISMLETSARAFGDAYDVLTDEDIKGQKVVRDVATLISMSVGLPASLAARPAGYLAGWGAGDIEPVDELDAARGLATGFASYESRQ